MQNGAPRASAGEMWDKRFAEEGWPSEPDPFLVELAEDLRPGRGLDLGSGPGRNSLWLAARGWEMTLVDASRVGLQQARAAADKMGLSISTVHADVAEWRPESQDYDLVVVANLHLGPELLALVLSYSSRALRPGGHLFVVGHHISNLGVHGPPDPDRLFTEDIIREVLPDDLRIEVLQTKERVPDHLHHTSKDDSGPKGALANLTHTNEENATGYRPDMAVFAWALKPPS
jgi:SAM-dependent methyltransferase